MESFKIPASWTLSFEEVSNNVYKVRLTSSAGPTVEMTGSALEETVAQCVEWAEETDKQLYETKRNLPSKRND